MNGLATANTGMYVKYVRMCVCHVMSCHGIISCCTGSVARNECLSWAVTFQIGSRGTGISASEGSTGYGGGVEGKCGAWGPKNAKKGGRCAGEQQQHPQQQW